MQNKYVKLKETIKTRRLTCGSWIAIGCDSTAEIMARAGFDWLVLDMEHAPIDITDASKLIRIIDLAGVPPVCRLRCHDPHMAKNVLDAGAAGIIVPMIETGLEAEQVVQSVCYPPKGRRGVGLGRAHGYGRDFIAYKDNIADNIVIIVMIETARGVKNIYDIVNTKGIDGVLIGPYDLSGSLGVIGQLEHPDVDAAMNKVLDAAEKAGIGCGLHIVHPDESNIKDAQQNGFTFLALGVDMIFLEKTARQFASLFHREQKNKLKKKK